MIETLNFARRALRAGTAFQALALMGAGVGLVALAAPASAQDYTNVTASGRVQSTEGRPIANATVELRSDRQGFSRTVTTDANGGFQVPQIPAGTYTFTITADGYDTYTEAAIPLTQSGAANQFTLASAGSAANSGDIVVTAGRQRVADFNQTTTGAVINVSDLANRVPVARDINSIIQLSPGTAQGDSAFGNLASVSGSSVGENQFFVNGLNITNFRNFLGANAVPFEFYDTVDVKNGGYPAEFGRATGGFVNATTKSGSNTFHAGALFIWAPRDLRDTSPNTQTADNDSAYSEDTRADFYLSGPIIKDHLFFYGLYENRYVKSGSGGLISKTFTDTKTTSPFFAGKVDAIITDGQRLEFTYFRTTGESTNVYSTYDPTTNRIGAYQSNNISQYGGDNYVGRYTGTFAKWLTVSAAYGRSNDRQNTISSTPNLATAIDYRSGTPGVNNAAGVLVPGSNAVTTQTRNEDKREFYRGDVDIYAKFLGSHHFRFGYDRENLTTIGTTNYTGGAYYRIYSSATLGDYVIRRQFENGGSFTSENTAYYAEDQWSLFGNRLSLNLGIRNDRFENKNPVGTTFYKSGNQWGPRLGFTFDPIGNGRSKIYGSFGRYFLPIAANTNIRLAGAQYDVSDYFLLSGIGANGQPILGAPINTRSLCIRNTNRNCSITGNGVVPSTDTTVGTNLKPQSVDEYILGGEFRLGQYWKFGTFFTYRNLNRALEDSAIDQAAIKYCNANNLGCASLYSGFSQYVLNNPGESLDVTLLDGTKATLTPALLGYPKATRTYKAMTFTVDREFDGKWSISGSYTLASNVGNYEGGVKSDIGQADTGLTQDFDQPGFTYGAYGYLPNHHRHNIKLYGSYAISDFFSVGANLQVVSPRKFGCIGVVPTSIDPYAAAYGVAGNYCRYANGSVSNANPIVLVQRGSAFQSDWQTSLDLTAQLVLPTDAINGSLRFEVFNVLNSKAVLKRNEFGGVDDSTLSAANNYKLPTQYQAPRYGRVTLALRF
ncbi:TonB-dependent receptor [Sphingomonas sp. MA1305]|uniref:TonB-dependent receptor n=1 Tax=Sphingomonas sp. MA1305 TaxID=2479204 RepID=UPI0018E04BA4|nr:TonB-dependent receptor [Sphingomonas sp. MA1305]